MVKILTFLRDDGNCQFTILVDVLGVDWPARPKRFDVVYHLLSMKLNQRIRIKVQTDEETPVPSVTPVFRSEEHTSELQSLMRSSYAVFCLTKKRHSRLHSNSSESEHTNNTTTTF